MESQPKKLKMPLPAGLSGGDVRAVLALVAFTIVFVVAGVDLAVAAAGHVDDGPYGGAETSYFSAGVAVFAIVLLFDRCQRAWASVIHRWLPDDAALLEPEAVPSG